MFNEVTDAQWLWYFCNYMEDKGESFEDGRDLVEYHASFIEPEAVRKIREARDNSVNVPDKEFVAGIEHFFGRKIYLPSERVSSEESESIDINAAIRKAEAYKKRISNPIKKVSTIDYSHWLDMNLE